MTDAPRPKGRLSTISAENETAERIVTPHVREDDDLSTEKNLRPRSLAEYVGQTRVKNNLSIFIRAALDRGEPLDHILLYGPPGLGKTTLAQIIAAEMGVSLRVTSGPAIERQGDLVSVLTNLQPGDVLFIDEIHRLNRLVEEVLYPAMEDFAVDIIVGKGPGARTMRIPLPKFTLVGATTRLALLTGPLRDRFGAVLRLEFYDDDSMEEIIQRSSGILGVELEEQGAKALSSRARGTPRIANRLLRRVRDVAQVMGNGVVTEAIAGEALSLLEIDHLGLDDTDRRLLETVIDKFDGGPVGIDTLAAATAEETDTIMDVYEPFLIQLGFLQRTPRGRIATRRAYEHLGRPYDPQRPGGLQQPLFQENE
jgi:Holliday junction DNA helicase RuvB